MVRSLAKFTEDALFASLQQQVQKDVDVSSFVSSNRSKQLILLVGPQGISWDSTLDFFIHHMSQYRPHQHLEALDGWMWPAIDLSTTSASNNWRPVLSHREIFDLLIQSNNDDLRRSMLQQLNTTWNSNSTHKGMILGSPIWDEDPTIVYDVVHFLKVPPADVTVVWVYPSSRYQQWQGLFHNTNYDNYTQWMCDPNQTLFHMERLDASLNGMRYCSTLVSWGLNVVILDQTGLDEAHQSTAHTIACRVMTNVACHSGWVDGLDPVVNEDNLVSQQYPDLDSPISWLEQVEFEGLLSDRDCYYRAYLLDSQAHFRHLFPAQLWVDCDVTDDDDDSAIVRGGGRADSYQYYESLVNTTFLWQELHANVGCGREVDYKAGVSNTTTTPIETSSMDSDIKQVESSFHSSVRVGMGMVAVLILGGAALWIGMIHRHRWVRRGRRQEDTPVLRQWNHDDENLNRFDLSTVKTCHVSGRYEDDNDYEDEVNLQAHQGHADEEHIVFAPSSVSSSVRPIDRERDFEEIDMQWMVRATNHAGVMS